MGVSRNDTTSRTQSSCDLRGQSPRSQALRTASLKYGVPVRIPRRCGTACVITSHAGLGCGAVAASRGVGAAGTGSLSRLSINALTATIRVEADIERAAISGRRTRPMEG